MNQTFKTPSRRVPSSEGTAVPFRRVPGFRGLRRNANPFSVALNLYHRPHRWPDPLGLPVTILRK